MQLHRNGSGVKILNKIFSFFALAACLSVFGDTLPPEPFALDNDGETIVYAFVIPRPLGNHFVLKPYGLNILREDDIVKTLEK